MIKSISFIVLTHFFHFNELKIFILKHQTREWFLKDHVTRRNSENSPHCKKNHDYEVMTKYVLTLI